MGNEFPDETVPPVLVVGFKETLEVNLRCRPPTQRLGDHRSEVRFPRLILNDQLQN